MTLKFNLALALIQVKTNCSSVRMLNALLLLQKQLVKLMGLFKEADFPVHHEAHNGYLLSQLGHVVCPAFEKHLVVMHMRIIFRPEERNTTEKNWAGKKKV